MRDQPGCINEQTAMEEFRGDSGTPGCGPSLPANTSVVHARREAQNMSNIPVHHPVPPHVGVDDHHIPFTALTMHEADNAALALHTLA